MIKKRGFRKKKFKDDAVGLSVTVFNNNIDGALRVLKKKVKNSNLMLELKKKAYYTKPSKIRREKKNLAKLRSKYNLLKQHKTPSVIKVC